MPGDAISPAHAEPCAVLLRKGLEPFGYYSQGSYLLEKRNAPALKRSIELFEAALRADEHYTPALIGLARAHALLAEYWFVPPAAAFEAAKTSIARVLDLTPGSAHAHALRSEVLAVCDWDWSAARREIEIALRLNPGSTFVRNNAVWLHLCTGVYDAALIEAQQALMIEPSSLSALLLLARAFIHCGEYQDAITMLSHLLQSDPGFHLARRYRAQAYILAGRPYDALGDLHVLPRERCDDLSARLPLLARAYAEYGDRARAAKIYAVLIVAARTEYVTFWNLATVAVGIGKLDEAMALLQKALAVREPTLHLLKSLPFFKPIAHRDAFRNILRAVGP